MNFRASLARAARTAPILNRLAAPVVRLRDAGRELADLKIERRQLQDALRQADGLPLPPKHLQIRVVSVYKEDFVTAGDSLVADIDAVLSEVGQSLSAAGRVLDFGCGPGRALRSLHYRGVPKENLYGSDIDAEAIEWAKENYERVAHFGVNNHEPPTLYPDHFFDCVYSVSVFTHLPEEMQHRWLAELRRVTRPGGLLVLTFHGENFHHLAPANVMCERGFFYTDCMGATAGLPGFYQTALHTDEYVRRVWSDYFDVLWTGHRVIHNHQDAALCRRPAD